MSMNVYKVMTAVNKSASIPKEVLCVIVLPAMNWSLQLTVEVECFLLSKLKPYNGPINAHTFQILMSAQPWMEDVIKCVQTHKDPISVAVVKDMNCRKIIPPVKVNDNVL